MTSCGEFIHAEEHLAFKPASRLRRGVLRYTDEMAGRHPSFRGMSDATPEARPQMRSGAAALRRDKFLLILRGACASFPRHMPGAD